MAGKLTLASSMGVTNGNFVSTPKSWGKEVTQNSLGQDAGTFTVTQAAEVQLPMAGITTRGWIRILNLSDANYIRWGFATGVYGGRIAAGEQIQIRLEPAANVFLIADTADCEIDYEVNSD